MCAVSVIGDYGMQRMDSTNWANKETHEAFQKLLDAAKEFDGVADQEDCPSEDKTDWMLETRILLLTSQEL